MSLAGQQAGEGRGVSGEAEAGWQAPEAAAAARKKGRQGYGTRAAAAAAAAVCPLFIFCYPSVQLRDLPRPSHQVQPHHRRARGRVVPQGGCCTARGRFGACVHVCMCAWQHVCMLEHVHAGACACRRRRAMGNPAAGSHSAAGCLPLTAALQMPSLPLVSCQPFLSSVMSSRGCLAMLQSRRQGRMSSAGQDEQLPSSCLVAIMPRHASRHPRRLARSAAPPSPCPSLRAGSARAA